MRATGSVVPVGLTKKNLQKLGTKQDSKLPDMVQQVDRKQFVNNFLRDMHQMEAKKVYRPVQNNVKTGAGNEGGLGQLDAGAAKLEHYDSVSQPNRTGRFNSVGRMGNVGRRIMVGGAVKPEMDSFYNDRAEIRQRM